MRKDYPGRTVTSKRVERPWGKWCLTPTGNWEYRV